MSKNQKSLRWHRRRAYAQIGYAHADQSLKAGNNNEFVTAMHETNRQEAAYGIAKANKAFFLIEQQTNMRQFLTEMEQRKNEKNS